jgi:hypothetical protein
VHGYTPYHSLKDRLYFGRWIKYFCSKLVLDALAVKNSVKRVFFYCGVRTGSRSMVQGGEKVVFLKCIEKG